MNLKVSAMISTLSRGSRMMRAAKTGRGYKMIICAFLFLCLEGKAQIYFDTTYNLNHALEWGWSVLVAPDSSYITLSNGVNISTSDGPFNFSHFTTEGGIINNKSYGDTGYQYYVGLPHSMFQVDNNQSYFFGGSVENNSTGTSDVMLVKFYNNGDTVFLRKYENNDYSAPYATMLTLDNHILLGGFGGPVGQHGDALLMKTDTVGNLIWRKTYGGIEDNAAQSICQLDAQHYIIATYKFYSGINVNPWIIRTDTAGIIVDQKEFVLPQYSCAMELAPTLDRNLIMSSCMDTIINTGDYDRPSFIAKLDTDYNFIWKTVFNDPQANALYISKQLSDSSIIFVGVQLGSLSNAEQGWIGKLDKDGNKIWQHTYKHGGNSSFNYFSDFQQTYDKGFIVTGSADGPTGQDMWLVKLDSNGCLQPRCFITSTGTIETTNGVYDLQVYPNPAWSATSVLYSIPPQSKQTLLQVFDLTGRLVKETVLTPLSHQQELNVSDWSNGVYLLTLKVEGETIKSAKLIVSR